MTSHLCSATLAGLNTSCSVCISLAELIFPFKKIIVLEGVKPGAVIYLFPALSLNISGLICTNSSSTFFA